jgi:cholesterol oxidase
LHGNENRGDLMERLGRPIDDLADHYEVIVVGSGYGGAIAACRLSRAGRSVALFERGREMHPGEYPSTMVEALGHIQTTGPDLGPENQKGDKRNLYWFHTDGQINVFSGCGLGGTSLVNASVSLQPDPHVFEDPRWPAGLRADEQQGLAQGYDAARAMLDPRCYPDTFPHLAKIDALRVAAGQRPVELTPINVTFRTGPNRVGVEQQACVGCGDCVTGCNHGAKNTVLMNYLPDAAAHQAQIFTEMDVLSVQHSDGDGRWIVHVQPLGVGRDTEFHAPPLPISADLVVLAAGTLGSTGILLRSQAAGLPLSAKLGHRFTGNGDVLGFAERPAQTVRAMGTGRGEPDPMTPAGPCITALIDQREPFTGDGVIIEDAVIPGLLAETVAAELVTQFGAGPQSPWRRTKERLSALVSLFTGGHRAATEHLQTFLLMGHDDDEGRLVLEDGHFRIKWPGAGASPFYRRATGILAEAAENGGGTFVQDPLSSRLFHDDLITVHPLGGCVMADGADQGVVDHRGRVFSSAHGETVYDNLIVADGSIVPLPLGVNPLLTISALAERSMAILCAERGWPVEPMAPVPPSPDIPPSDETTPGLRFTERMTGWWAEGHSPDDGTLDQYQSAADRSSKDPMRALSFVLTLSSDDIRSVIAKLDTPMVAVGTVEAPCLSSEPLTVAGGQFQLLVADDPDPAVSHMRYQLSLSSVEGHRYFFDGFKKVAPGEIGELWGDTSTLYVTLRTDSPTGSILGRGVLRIEPSDFARQLRSLNVVGQVGFDERLHIEFRFGRAFAGPLVRDYGTVIHRTTSFNPSAPPRRQRALDVPPSQVYEYRTADGLSLRLTRYRGGESAPVVLSHGMGNPLTWSMDTNDRTLLEVLVANEYDVWLQEWRSSTLLPTARTQFNGDQVAHFDHPAAAEVIARESGRSDLHLVTHCVGSLTWLMATLAGDVEPTSLFCSALGVHPVAPTLTRIKVGLHLGETLHRIGIRMLTTDSLTNESFLEHLFDRELRLYPIPEEEECDQAVCRRVAFIYGNGVRHDNLNPATHAALHELFGPSNLTMLGHLSLMARAERVLTASGKDDYLPHLERLQRPITLASGTDNLVWLPESTERTFDLLVKEFDPSLYRRVVFDRYGHQDVFNGASAYRDTFPAVLKHLKDVNA